MLKTAEPKEKCLWVLDEENRPRPEIDETAWEKWREANRPRLSGKVTLGERVIGWRFAGWELGLNSRGDPLLWELVVWDKGIVQVTGKFPSLELLDYHMLYGMLPKISTRILKLRFWHAIQVMYRYARWRRSLGGWSWKYRRDLRKNRKLQGSSGNASGSSGT